jgi:hypothetical protein
VQARASGIGFSQFFNMSFFASIIDKLLVGIDKLQNVVQRLLSSELFFEVASLLDAVWHETLQIVQSVGTVSDDLA